jgi:hypothetical protein|tara:strand:- start:516 stop:719 length:204 start_codon:yes stop_codon:yes gene_type:complete
MTKPFWTPEKKEEYNKLRKQRDAEREYMREYMRDARNSGRYKYYRNGNKVIYEKDETRFKEKIHPED